MKIEDKRDKETEFGNLKEGEVFADAITHHIYLKIFESAVDGDIANTVDLSNGELSFYSVKEIVLKLNAKVVIE